MKNIKKNGGGKRVGAGRPKSEPTKVIQTRVRISLIVEFRLMVQAWKNIHYKKGLK